MSFALAERRRDTAAPLPGGGQPPGAKRLLKGRR
jgi:hypothetical protein